MEGRDVGELANRLRRLREAAALTQEELAERAGLTANAIGALERGERRRPYPHTVRVLADALGLDDGERSELAAVARAGRSAAASPASTVSPANQPGPPLVGRRRELWEVVTALTSGTRLLTVTGPGGVGKTRLATEAARRAATLFGGAVTVVELAAVRDPALVMPTVAQALGVAQSGGQDVLAALVDQLGGRPRLLVLDNLEHLLPAAAEIGRLVEACPGVVVLATSRAPLRLRTEQDLPLAPLSLPEASDVASVSASGAGQMLLERARAVSPAFALTDRTAPAIASICRQLDGLPLALELAAAHARLLNADALLARLDQAVSSPRARDLPDRQSTIRATLDWSHDLLTLDEQTTLRRLAVFAGGFGLDAAEAVVGVDVDVFAALAGLVDQSMVLALPEPAARYRLLEPVRQYAAVRLAESGEADDVADRHSDWACGLGHEARDALRARDQAVWLDLLEAEHANQRAALERLIARGRLGRAARLLSDTWLGWALRGYATEGLDWTERVRGHASVEGLDADGRAFLELATAGFRYATGDLAGTAAAGRASVDHDPGTEPPVRQDALILQGSGEMVLGDPAAAETLARAVAEARAIDDLWAMAHALLADAQRFLTVGDFEAATATLTEAERLARELGSPFTLATVVNVRATQSLLVGDEDAALQRYQETTRLSAEVGTTWTLVYGLPGLATVAARRGQMQEAAVLFAAGATTSDASSLVVAFPPDLAFAQEALSAVRAELGEEAFQAAWERGRDLPTAELPAWADRVRPRRAPR
jgi:predicted ATPase/transcriptional regulator with XRE-family HTH domain